MSAFDLFTVRFLLASAGCLAAGLAVWGALLLCRRWLPALALQRTGWLLGQVVVALTFVLLLAPQARPMHALPVFEVDLSPDTAAAGSGSPAPLGAASVHPAGAAGKAWLAHAALAWLAMYALGLVVILVRLVQGQRALARLVRVGRRIEAPGARPAMIEVDAPIPPMLVGVMRPCLLLPRALCEGDPLQRELIVAHELTHWRRRDLWWLSAATVLQILLWFNPVMRLLRARLAWSQELACDRDVLRGRPAAQRRAYAAALLGQMDARLVPGAALAFGGVDPDTLSARVALIRTPATLARAGHARGAGLAVLALVFGANLALQPALAWHARAPAGLDCTIMLDAVSGAPIAEEGDCGLRATPASTFNIAVSLMGFDSGILRDAHAPALPFKPGYADWQPSWRATTDPTDWIRNSTVWYAQQVTTRLGGQGLRDYVGRFDYGNQDLSGGLANAWITSSLQISPREQVAFLRKLAMRELPVSAHALDMTAQLLRLPTLSNGWNVYGKTGTAFPLLGDGSEDPDRAWGWFVGWASKDGRAVVFARLVLAKRQSEGAAGPLLKASFLRELPARLERIPAVDAATTS